MLSEMFCVFQKRLIYKEKCRAVQKIIKSVKNVIIKKSATKVFQVCISIVYYSFILKLSISISISTALVLWRWCKIRTSFKAPASQKTTIWRLKKSHSNEKPLEKITSSSYHMEQNIHRSKLIYDIHTGKKNFL